MSTAVVEAPGAPSDGSPVRCPMCHAANVRLIRSASELAGDLRTAMSDGRQLMHSTAASVHRCERCRSIFRDPASLPSDLESRYRHDAYPEHELHRLHLCEVAAFRADGDWWRAHVLERGSRVLEIGSYVGGFLTLARQSACHATGFDVGVQVSAFTRALGLDVRTGVFAPDEFEAETFDFVVVLNCLEQLADPPATVQQIRRVLRRHGALVVRTPNADFVRRAHEPSVRPSALANGVLGAPFVRCWSVAALDGMLRRSGFPNVRIGGSMAGAGCTRSRGPTGARATETFEYPWIDALARLG